MAAACGGVSIVTLTGSSATRTWCIGSCRHDTSQETLIKSGYGQMDGPITTTAELYSGVTVIASPRDLLQTGTLWESDRTVVVPADTTQTIVAKLRQPAYAIDAVNYTAVSGGPGYERQRQHHHHRVCAAR